MKAVQFRFSLPRYGLGIALGSIFPALLPSGLLNTGIHEISAPTLPGPDWLSVNTRLGGVCGTDLAAIYLHASPYYSVFSSFPFTFGHENVGTISQVGANVKGWEEGQRVVVEPTLWCAPRGFAKKDWCPNCKLGEINRCQHYSQGEIAPGIMIGTASQTGGSWSENFVAHESQILAVPDSISDENALMLEPFACALHAALIDFPSDDETILILGAGTIGLVTLAALRTLGSKANIVVSARYDFQEQAARKLGASEVLRSKDLYTDVAENIGGTLYKPTIGKRVLVGGADRVYECVGSDSALDDAHRLCKSGGTVVLVGVPGQAKGVDWTAIFSQELKIVAADRYSHSDTYKGKKVRSFELGLQLMASGKVDLGWMVNRTYNLKEYRKMLSDLRHKKKNSILKAAFLFPEKP